MIRLLLLPAMTVAMGALTHSAQAMPRHEAGIASSPAIIDVAHAGAPNKNVNHRNDAGNNTGDSEVDRLNSMQLDENYKGPYYAPGSQPPAPAPMPSQNRR